MKIKNGLFGLLGIAIIVIAFLASGAIISNKPQPKKDNKKHNSMYVKAETVAYTDSEHTMTYRGRVTTFDNISLSSEVSGKILQGNVRFKSGESFDKGDVLIKIYKEDIEANLKSGKSSFLQVISMILPDLKVDYPNEYNKWNNFFKSIDVEKTLPDLPSVNSDQEKIFLASNNVLSNYYSLQQQEINLKRYTIFAPFDGSFKQVNKEIGSIATMGAELASIFRTDKLEITVPVFPEDLSYIKKGDQVAVIDRDGIEHNATVSRIADYIDETTQRVNIYLTYKSTNDNSILLGEYVDISLGGVLVSGFEVPREALINGNSIYELANKKLEKKEVEILHQLDDSYIIAGIDSGKIVVTESLASINSNVEYLAR